MKYGRVNSKFGPPYFTLTPLLLYMVVTLALQKSLSNVFYGWSLRVKIEPSPTSDLREPLKLLDGLNHPHAVIEGIEWKIDGIDLKF